MIDKWIAEATECDFKVALEVRKPKSWLKSAFANGIGGTLFFGIDDNRNVVGLADAQADAEAISRLIKERITPYPNFILTPEREKGRDILILSISAGRSTPYYYKADGVMEAYIRMGNESVMAPSYVLNQLLLKGMNHTFDALISEYNFKDYAFSKLRERYKGNEKDIAQEPPDFIGGFAVSTVEIFTSDFVDVKKVFFPFCSEPNSRTTEYKPPSAWIRTNPCAFLFPQKGGKTMDSRGGCACFALP